jgi:Tol biopolymer transport system component
LAFFIRATLLVVLFRGTSQPQDPEDMEQNALDIREENMITKQPSLLFALHPSRRLLLPLLVSMFLLASCISARGVSVSTHAVSTSEVFATSTSTRLPATDVVAASTPAITSVDVREKLSPGLYVAYWSQGTWYIREVGGSNSIQLMPGVTSEFYTDIRLSPDSDQVAFSNTAGQVSVYDLHTHKLTTYSNSEIKHAYQFQWSPDGNTLLYLGTPEQYWIPDSQVGIYSILLSTGETSKVVSRVDDRFRYGLGDLNLSKNGKWLAFDTPRLSEMMAPDPNYATYVMDTSCLANPETCTESIHLVGNGYAPDWSPDGRLWWSCSLEKPSALCVTDMNILTSSDVFVTASELTNSSDAVFSYFSWSPDGKYVAMNVQKYRSGDSGDTRDEIYLMSTDSSQPIKVIAATDKNEYLEWWSPDSQYLAYSQILGYTEPQGDLGIRFSITDLYLYDVQNHTKIDFIDTPGEREVFGFFVQIK